MENIDDGQEDKEINMEKNVTDPKNEEKESLKDQNEDSESLQREDIEPEVQECMDIPSVKKQSQLEQFSFNRV